MKTKLQQLNEDVNELKHIRAILNNAIDMFESISAFNVNDEKMTKQWGELKKKYPGLIIQLHDYIILKEPKNS